MPYSGPGTYTAWMSLGYGGVANPTATSEQISVLVDGVTTYSAVVKATPATANWASGFTVSLSFYTSGNILIGSPTTASSGALTAGTISTVATTAVTAPGTASYCVAAVQYNGSPTAANNLKIYSFQVATGANTNIPSVVNYNYAFVNGTWPWVGSNSAILADNAAVLTGAAGNYDSLVIAGIVEVMGGPGGVPCLIPNLTAANGNAATFRISTPGGQLQTLSTSGPGPYDLGDFQPTQDFVESLLLDGERPFGTRSSNRTMTLPIAIYAPTQATLVAARDYLLSIVDQQTFEIASTPAGNGLTTIYQCFRALPSVVMYGFNNNREGATNAPAIGLVTLTIQALPYGKSGIDGIQQVNFPANLSSTAPAGTPVVLDSFSGTIDSADGWIINTQYPVYGSYCVFHRNPVPVVSPYPATVYQRSGLTPANIAGLQTLAIWMGQSYDTQWPADPTFVSTVTVAAVLTDNNSNTISCQQTVSNMPWNSSSSIPAWTQVALPIPQLNPAFNYNAVTGYKLTITNWAGAGTSGYVRMQAWLGEVSAQPQAVTNITYPRATLFNVWGMNGSARTSVSAQVQFPNADPVAQELVNSGTFKVPSGVHSLTAECWGAGGAGASVSSTLPGGGGGGGEYAQEPSLAVTPGQEIPVTIGTGGVPGQVIPTVLTFRTHGVGTSWTCPANVTSVLVECIGGGAAGAPGGGGGGGGGCGNKTVTVTPGTTYPMWVGSGGQPNTGTTSQAQASRNGQHTWFGNPGAWHIANSLVGGYGGTSPVAGSANGGLGGSSFGGAPGYSGGGGGRSPGGAGGGGGASASPTGPGLPGAASPKLGTSGAGDYLTGGAGGSGPGGAGGAGASVPGAAGLPVTPGGGGGGGYTKTVTSNGKSTAVNYQGSTGAPGYIRLTYSTNGGNAVNGTSTVFGSAATTSTVVTANGASSAANNTGVGGAGGTGSSNTIHFNGGTGSLCERNANMIAVAGSNQYSLGSASVSSNTTATVTSGTTLTAAAMEQGVMLVAAVMSAVPLTNVTGSDSAGNVYYLNANATQTLTDGSCLQVLVSTCTYPVTSGTVLTLTSGTGTNWAVVWGAIAGVRDLEDTVVAGNSGNSTTASVARTYPDTSAMYYELVVFGNDNSSTTMPTGMTSAPAASMFTSKTNGTLGLNFAGRLANGSASALTLSGTVSSEPWALITLPFILTNQDGQAITTIVNANVSSTTQTVTNTVGGSTAINIDANTGYLLVKIHTAGTAATMGVSDSGTNTYTSLGAVDPGTGKIYMFGAPVTHSLAAGWTMTITSSSSQGYSVTAWLVPGGTAADATGVTSNTGSTTAVSLAYPSATTNAACFQLAVLGYPAASDVATNAPSWSGSNSGIKLGAAVGSSLTATDDYYALQQNGFGGTTLTTTLTTTESWAAIVVSVVSPTFSGGGGASGGTGGAGVDASSGTSGGAPSYTFGGKGANSVSGNASGSVGATPGGGGSGASRISGTTAYTGGNGGNGLVRVTYQPPVIGFNDFILHRPGQNAPPDLNPLVPIPASDPPDNREYAVPSTVAGRNAVFRGTYTVMLCAAAWDTPGNTRRLSVTVNQYEYPGGPAVSVQATRTLTPATDIVNGYVSMGELTLPIKSVNASNTDCYYTVSIHCTDQNDSFQDLIFLDTTGQTCLVNIAPGTAGDSQYVNFYIDEPGLQSDLGAIMGSSHDRSRAVSTLDMAMPTGGPLYINSGSNLLLAYSSKGAPSLQLTYSPRWYSDRMR